MKECKVTYLQHSGFLMETEKCYLLFDFWKGELPPLSYEKPMYIFASHAHQDHYDKRIFKLENSCRKVTYILSFDIREADSSWKKAENVWFLDPDQTCGIGELTVETLRSTDEGIAFLIRTDGMTIYHAGDLHWWEWPGEPEEENQAYIRRYKDEIRKIAGRKIDIAFVVLDPRQEEAGERGMDHFLAEVGARYVFPMHFWNDYGLIMRYRKKNQLKYITSRIMEITKAGQAWILQI